MANIILQKRSATSGAKPDATQIVAGEIAVNTADGNVFIKTTDGDVVNLLDYSIADGGEIT